MQKRKKDHADGKISRRGWGWGTKLKLSVLQDKCMRHFLGALPCDSVGTHKVFAFKKEDTINAPCEDGHLLLWSSLIDMLNYKMFQRKIKGTK